MSDFVVLAHHEERVTLTSQPRRARPWCALLGAGLCAVLLVGLTGCSSSSSPSAVSSSSQPPLGFRSLPTFLPTTGQPVDRVVTASPGHPQLAVQGVAVQLDLPSGSVLATVTGPSVPPFVAPPPPAVTATFTITLANPTGTVAVAISAFTITDQLGRTYHPSLVAGEAAPPAIAPGGRTTTFRLTAVMPTGEGRIYWSPDGGAPIAGWDFIVEND